MDRARAERGSVGAVLLWADALAQGRSEGTVPLDGGDLTFSRLPCTGQSPVSIHERIAIRALLTFADAEVAEGEEEAVTFENLPTFDESEVVDAIQR